MIGALIAALTPVVGNVLDRLIPDAGAAAKAKHEITTALLANSAELEASAAKIVQAEASSEHWLTASWRPILMLVIAAIVANNYLFAPYLNAIFGAGVQLQLPDRLWDLLTLGVGGYVVGRSGEKIARTWKAKD